MPELTPQVDDETLPPGVAFVVGSLQDGRIERCSWDFPYPSELALMHNPPPYPLHPLWQRKAGSTIERLPEALRHDQAAAIAVAAERGALLVLCIWPTRERVEHAVERRKAGR